MNLLLSSNAPVFTLKKHFARIGVLMFEGTPPTALDSLPFDPNDLASVMENAVGSFYTDPINVEYDTENSNAVASFPVKSVANRQLASFQHIPASIAEYSDEFNRPVAKIYGEKDDLRQIGDFISRQHASTPYFQSSGDRWDWYLSEYLWTYFEFAKEIEVNQLIMGRGRYQGTTDLTLQFLDPEDGVWKDITLRDLADDLKNIEWSGNYNASYGRLIYGGSYEYKFTFTNPVTAKKLRMRSSNISPVDNPTTMRQMRSVSFGTTTDLSDIERDITPTWGIAYGWNGTLTGDLESKVRNPYFIFEFGDSTDGKDFELSTLTFDPKLTGPQDLTVTPISIKINPLV